VPDVPYVESILAWGHNMLWSRNKALTLYDKSFFRAEFELDVIPEVAKLKLFSPAHYDFDIAAANFGNIAKMMEDRNSVQAYINGVAVCADAVREWDDVIKIDTNLLKKGKNLIAFSAANGFDSRGGCCGIYLNDSEKSIPLNFVSMPSKFEVLDAPKIENGKDFVVENAINNNGFTTIKISIADERECLLIGENGRIFIESPANIVYRVNAYSGAEMPFLRSDEFFSITENFAFEVGGISFQSCTPGTIGMVFRKEKGICRRHSQRLGILS
jgi:hypothetical protein